MINTVNTMNAVFLDTQTFAKNINFNPINLVVNRLTEYAITSPEEVIARCTNINIIITNKVVLTKETLEKLPQLKLICIAATGFNNVDIEAAKALNIAVTNVSGYAQNSVAQYIFSQLLAYFSAIEQHNQNVENGLWQTSSTFCHHGDGFSEIAGKKLGIIGYGNLGQKVAQIAQSFGMKVLVAERPESKNIREGRIAFNNVIEQSDVISIHCPHTSETENLIDSGVLNRMKASSVLINTARGAVVDEDALLNALQKNKISYAILDVLKNEPPQADHKLLNAQLNNLKVTAHIAWGSFEAQDKLLQGIADNITAYMEGKRKNRVES